MTDIIVGANILYDIRRTVENCSMVVTDANVAAAYPDLTSDAFVIPSGEQSKNKDILFSVIEKMLERRLSRNDRVAALGGGVVGDITGLAAALYMRGVEWVNIPTTLLAQVDAGIGGKTAIDLCGVKNPVGAFHAPAKTVISYEFLETIGDRERICGYGEMIKTCLLNDSAYRELLKRLDGLAVFNRDDVYALIERCIAIKSDAVERDPKENGLRAVLNVGHTVGHALESADGYRLSHGEYVLKGIMTECAMFDELVSRDFSRGLTDLCKMFTAPPRTTSRSVTERAAFDKKNTDGDITVMLPIDAGDILRVGVSPETFAERYDRAVKALRQ